MTTDKPPDVVRRYEDALGAIRKAAGGCKEFTNRLQFIYERAGVALAGEEWSEEWKTQYGYHVRNRVMADNERLQYALDAMTAERDALKRKLQEPLIYGEWQKMERERDAAREMLAKAQKEAATARALAVEQAARICECVGYDNPMTALDCADAIRALCLAAQPETPDD